MEQAQGKNAVPGTFLMTLCLALRLLYITVLLVIFEKKLRLSHTTLRVLDYWPDC